MRSNSGLRTFQSFPAKFNLHSQNQTLAETKQTTPGRPPTSLWRTAFNLVAAVIVFVPERHVTARTRFRFGARDLLHLWAFVGVTINGHSALVPLCRDKIIGVEILFFRGKITAFKVLQKVCNINFRRTPLAEFLLTISIASLNT